MSSPPKLWSWQLSPFAGKARIALAVKGIDVELLEIDPIKRPARLRELNPNSRVPVLEVGGVAVRESSAICEWADETHPEPPLWPDDPVRRAAARGLMRWVDDELTVNFFLSMRKEAFGIDEAADAPGIVGVLRERLARRWRILDGLIERSGGPWLLGGDGPWLCDLAGMPLAVRIPVWKPELAPDADRHPRAAAWLEALREHPAAPEVDRRGGDVPD